MARTRGSVGHGGRRTPCACVSPRRRRAAPGGRAPPRARPRLTRRAVRTQPRARRARTRPRRSPPRGCLASAAGPPAWSEPCPQTSPRAGCGSRSLGQTHLTLSPGRPFHQLNPAERSNTTMVYTSFQSPIGELLAVGDGQALHGLYMQEGRTAFAVRADWERAEEPFGEVRTQLADYFDGRRTVFDLPLAMQGTPFQVQAWRALQDIR